jgi:hypothetical protein
MVKISIFLILTFLSFMPASGFAQNQGNQFEYSQEDIPEICFFPSEKARWDGYTVTNKNWNLLTDFQKMTFVSEAIAEIELNENVTILLNDEERLLSVSAISAAVEKAEADNIDFEFPVIKLLYESLKDAEKLNQSSGDTYQIQDKQFSA